MNNAEVGRFLSFFQRTVWTRQSFLCTIQTLRHRVSTHPPRDATASKRPDSSPLERTVQSHSGRGLWRILRASAACEAAIIMSFAICACLALCAVAALAAPIGSESEPCQPDKLTVYKVVLHTFWSREKFPKHYPDWRPPAQWSKVFGESMMLTGLNYQISF